MLCLSRSLQRCYYLNYLSRYNQIIYILMKLGDLTVLATQLRLTLQNENNNFLSSKSVFPHYRKTR